MADRLIGIREAAARLGMSPRELGNKCREGTSPVRCSRRGDGPKPVWVFLDSEVDEYIHRLFADSKAPMERQAATG